MVRLAGGIIRHKKPIIVLFAVIVVACAFLQAFVHANYKMGDYLPQSAKSTVAIELMNAEFPQSLPNAGVMVRNVSVTEALVYKQALSAVDGVTQVLWLDDVVDLKIPLSIADPETVEEFYKDGNALFSVAIAEGKEQAAYNDIITLIGENGAIAGEAADLVAVQNAAKSEVLSATLILMPIILLLLVLSTSSWVEPVLFLAAIGVSIVINIGTNAFLTEVSFITKTVTPILQLACSLDYAIFLLHSFSEHRRTNSDPESAMMLAICDSVSTVAASAATTLFGFLALVFMRFGIGADLGLNLAKGIVFSFLSVMIFLPALTLVLYKLIDKTQHKALMPSFRNAYRVISKVAFPVIVAIVMVVLPCYIAQSRAEFTYGMNMSEDVTRRIGRDTIEIREMYGQSNVLALLVPRGDVAREGELCREIGQLEHVSGVVSYATSVGTKTPSEILDSDVTDQFYSENLARIIIYTDTPTESASAFATVEAVETTARSYYMDDVYVAGQSASLYDMRSVLQQDFTLVTLIAVVAIFIVLLITFRSATLPFILLFTIESGIWINLAIPYLTGVSISFIGYLIVSSVQLGATVDYAILLTNNYVACRRLLPKKEAIGVALGQSFRPILVSASILTAAGLTLFYTSSNEIISELGLLIGRGALLSAGLVTLFLPGVLRLLDSMIAKTTYRAEFIGSKTHQSPGGKL